MAVRVIFFGRLKDDLACTDIEIDWHGGSGHDLLAQLRSRSTSWSESLAEGKVFRLAINQQISKLDAVIQDKAEVAILPPVTGG